MKTGLETEGFDTVRYDQFNSRKEIERYQKKMERYLDRNANFGVMNEKGVMLEYSDVRELEKRIKKVNRKKAKEFDKIKDLPFNHKGQPTGVTVGQQANPEFGMGDSRFSDFRGLKFNPHRFDSAGDLKKRIARMDELYEQQDFMKKKNELLKANYLKGMSEAGLMGMGVNIAKRIQEMGEDEFVRQFYTENNASITFLYDKVSKEARVNELNRIWNPQKGA